MNPEVPQAVPARPDSFSRPLFAIGRCMMSRKRDVLVDGAHLFALSNLAVAQPLYDLLGRNAEFFVARRSDPVDVLFLSVGLSLLIPAIFLLTEGLAGLLGHRVRRSVHYFWIGALVATSLLPPLKSLDALPDRDLILVAAISGAAVALGYWRFKPLRSPFSLGVMVLAALAFPMSFTLASPISSILMPKGALSFGVADFDATTPIFMMVFDEFPVTSLMDEQGMIDPVRYPNFAALAKDAHWYRAATTPVGDTLRSVPAILSGLKPSSTRDKSLPTAAEFPHTLFTLLGDSYELEVIESLTQLCPEELCEDETSDSMPKRLRGLLQDLVIVYLHIIGPPGLTSGLPAVTQNWGSFARDHSSSDVTPAAVAPEAKHEKFASFLRTVDASDKPTLYFLHMILPHVPWEYLPSGKRYTRTRVPGLNLAREKWGGDEWLVLQGYQRHLLQVSYVDKLVGELLGKLHDLDMYDKSLIVLTADHGVNFWANRSRRGTLKEFPREVLGVPLLIKEPNQESGSIEDFEVKTIDILPTIAGILGVPVPWPLDGQSIREKENVTSSKFDPLHYAPLRRKLAQFGSGSRPDSLFEIGPYKELVGRALDSIGVTGEAAVAIAIDQAKPLARVDPESEVIPSHVTGHVLGDISKEPKLNLAVSVNGTVRAVTRTYWARRRQQFGAMVPESTLRRGVNNVEVFVISDGVGGIALKRRKSKSE